jgi:hypothetical protein
MQKEVTGQNAISCEFLLRVPPGMDRLMAECRLHGVKRGRRKGSYSHIAIMLMMKRWLAEWLPVLESAVLHSRRAANFKVGGRRYDALTLRDVKNEDRSGYVYENKC